MQLVVLLAGSGRTGSSEPQEEEVFRSGWREDSVGNSGGESQLIGLLAARLTVVTNGRRVEALQPEDIRGEAENIFFMKYNPDQLWSELHISDANCRGR